MLRDGCCCVAIFIGVALLVWIIAVRRETHVKRRYRS